jgi:rare lipoprotein A
MSIHVSALLSVAISLFIVGCATQPDADLVHSANATGLKSPSSPRRQVGAPYVVHHRVYYPRHQPDYDEIGLASWLGEEFRGLTTANGEIFDPQNLFAAHPTLPLPSYVDIENLKTGRRLTVRVNDRGPFIPKQIIALSERAAEILGFKDEQLALVRVRFIAPAPLHHFGRDTAISQLTNAGSSCRSFANAARTSAANGPISTAPSTCSK